MLIVASTLAIQPLACQLNHFPLLVPRSGRGTRFEGTLLRNSSTSRLKACHHKSWTYSLEFPLWCHRSWSLQWCTPIPWGCKHDISGTPGRQAKTPGFNERFHPRNFRHWSISTRKPEVQKIFKNSKKWSKWLHDTRIAGGALINWQTDRRQVLGRVGLGHTE